MFLCMFFGIVKINIFLLLQIVQTRSSCNEALKELKHWMVPQKVSRVNTLLVRHKDENSLHSFLFLTTISSNIYYNAKSIYNVELSMFVSGQHFNHNISIISRNCVRTSRSCVGHLNMELPFLYVNILLHSSHLTS